MKVYSTLHFPELHVHFMKKMIQYDVLALGGRNGLEFEQNLEKCVLKTCPLVPFPPANLSCREKRVL